MRSAKPFHAGSEASRNHSTRNTVANTLRDTPISDENSAGLGQDTLLSKEELALYSTLENSGALRTILESPEIDATRPLFDEDLRKSIETLNASTAAIQRQTEILTSQCEHLNRQIRMEGERDGTQSRELGRLRQKHEAGRQGTAAASNDLIHELEACAKGETEKATADGKRILASLAARFKEDDRIIADLEKLGAGIKSTGDDAAVLKKTSDLGTLLSQLVAEEIQCRLDRLYVESLQTHGGETDDMPLNVDEDEALVALEGELESLYPEIDVLAEMSTKRQFSELILRELENHHGQLRIASHEKLDHILNVMIELASSTEQLTKSLRERESYCGAVEAFGKTYRSEIGDPFSEQANSRRETLRRRSVQPTLKPPRNTLATLPESQAIAGILRRVGLPFESVFQSEKEDGGANALAEKREHLLEGLRNYGIAADSPLIAETTGSDHASRLLLSSLHAHSHLETSLCDAEYENKLSALASQLSMIQKGIGRLDMDPLYRRDMNREKFMEHWS